MIMNSNWIYKKFGDVCTVERGGSPRPIDKFITDSAEGINWIKIGDTSDSMYITSTAQKIIPEGMKKSRYVKPGDFLLSNSMSFGRPYILKIDGCIHDGWLVLRDNNNLFDKRFLYYYLSSPSIYQKFKMMAVGGVVNNLNSEMVRGVEIPIPTIDEQIEIANILDRVNELIANRKQQLAKLDELVKARFVEMFGDPIRNSQNRPITDFINVVKMQRGFDLPVQDRQQDGDILVFGSNGALDRHNVAKVCGGGVITGRSGTIGRVYYTEGDYWPLNTSLFSVDTHGNNIIYLAYLLQMYDLSRFTEGTGVPTLNRNKFHNKPIIDVPLNEQKQFATFVKQIDKSKFEVQKSLEKLETLKKSLMQQYFG